MAPEIEVSSRQREEISSWARTKGKQVPVDNPRVQSVFLITGEQLVKGEPLMIINGQRSNRADRILGSRRLVNHLREEGFIRGRR